jgi:hypothetical protein
VGRDKLVTEFSTYPSCTIHCYFSALYIDMELLRSECMLLPNIAASGITYILSMWVLGYIFGH